MATSSSGTTPQAVLTAYFGALTRHDLDAIAAAWAPDGHSHISGQADASGPDGVLDILRQRQPHRDRLDLEGLDLFVLRDGLIVREDAYTDGATFARQIGL